MKDKILQHCKRLGVNQLLPYVINKTVTIEELAKAGVQPEKIDYINGKLSAMENSLYQKAVNQNTVEACDEYLSTYPYGLHAEDVRDIKMALKDAPWLQTVRLNTIEGYEEYASHFPGQHAEEIESKIADLREEKMWQQSLSANTCEVFDNYLKRYPEGRHADEAQKRINRLSYKEHSANVLRELREDVNAYSAQEIQFLVENDMMSWDDLNGIFDNEELDAVKSFTRPTELPDSLPPDALQKNTTEVYFWGTPSSGKTCALGALISRMDSKGILEKLNCGGYNYMTRLSNIFGYDSICTFPDSTSIGSIQEMVIRLKDECDKYHRLTLIDLAGELFRSVYFKRHNLILEETKDTALTKAIDYLTDNKNKKIHFFVVEYGAHDKQWEGLTMKNYLDDMVGFLKENNIFRKSTVGVYVLVTKCDKIKCNVKDRPKAAFDYICNNMPAFWTVLQDTCKEVGVKDVSVLAYSVGNVFAQKLCRFDARDTEKVIKRLLLRTDAEGGMFDWLRG